MKSFYLVRHTEFDNPRNIYHGLLPMPLSAEGKAHAARIAEWFRDKKIKKIFSSEVERCKEISQIIASTTKAPIHFDRRLLDTFTAVQGMALSEYTKDRNQRFSSADYLAGETMMDIQVRVLDFFYEKMKEEKENIIICSHGDPLYFLYLGLTKENVPQKVEGFHRDQYHKKGAIRRIDIDGEKYTLGPLIEL